MYCPNCSQPVSAIEVQFCSSCGFPLARLNEIIPGGGKTKNDEAKAAKNKLSPRQKGLRLGLALMLLSVILIPAYVLLAALFPANDRLVESAVSDTPFEKISQAILITMFMLGLARAAYAWFFQEQARPGLEGGVSAQALPPAEGAPVSAFGGWRANTGELQREGRRQARRS